MLMSPQFLSTKLSKLCYAIKINENLGYIPKVNEIINIAPTNIQNQPHFIETRGVNCTQYTCSRECFDNVTF